MRLLQHDIDSFMLQMYLWQKQRLCQAGKNRNAAGSDAAAHLPTNQDICLWYTVLLLGLKSLPSFNSIKQQYRFY